MKMWVEDKLAAFCIEPKCNYYGLASSCPPHVSGPCGMRDMLKKSMYVLVVKIDLPSSVLLTEQRREVMQVLHELVAGVEKAAVERGFSNSKGFAGGSCKDLFCSTFSECQNLSENSCCRNPDKARASMSGYGINVGKMLEAAGWEVETGIMHENFNGEKMSWIAGMILITK